MTNSTCSWSKA